MRFIRFISLAVSFLCSLQSSCFLISSFPLFAGAKVTRSHLPWSLHSALRLDIATQQVGAIQKSNLNILSVLACGQERGARRGRGREMAGTRPRSPSPWVRSSRGRGPDSRTPTVTQVSQISVLYTRVSGRCWNILLADLDYLLTQSNNSKYRTLSYK